MKSTTIIIPVFNNLNYTKGCIDSIYENTDIDSFNLIIVDNASSDGTNEYLNNLKDKYSNFQFITNTINYGFAKANNQAVKIAKTDKVLFLNNDTKVTRNWFYSLEKSLSLDHEIKIVGSKLLYEDNTIQHAGIVISKFSDTSDNQRKIIYHIHRLFDCNHYAVNRSRYFQAVTGACMLTYKDFFTDIGGFDENYQNGFEDIDLCLRAGEKEAKIFYCSESVVFHYESKTPGRHNNTNANTDIFYKKWHDKLIADDYKYYLEDGFNLINIQREWRTINSNLKQEYLDIIFEQNSKNPETLILFKTENNIKEYILQFQINTSRDFSLLIFSKSKDKFNLQNTFTNVGFKSETNFLLDDLLDYISINGYKKIIFADSIYYQWDKDSKIYNTDELISCIQKIKSGNINFADSELIKNLSSFINELDLILALDDIYIHNSEYRESIKHLEKSIIKYPMNKRILICLGNSLYYSGDKETSERIKKIVDTL